MVKPAKPLNIARLRDAAHGVSALSLVVGAFGILASGVACAQSLSAGGVHDGAVALRKSDASLQPASRLSTGLGDVMPSAPPESAVVSRLQRAMLASAKADAATSSSAAGRLVLDDLVSLAIQAHPEVVAKRADLNSAQAGRDAALWQYFPTPSLQSRQQGKGGNVTVAALQQPIWSGGRLDASLDAANSRALSATVAITEAQYALALRVASAWQSWVQSRGRAEALGRGKNLLEVYADSVRQRIKGGISPEVDRELVESRLAQVRGDLAAAKAAERSALSQLSQLTGRALRTEKLAPAKTVSARLPAFDLVLEQALEHSATLRRIEAEVEAARHDITQKRASLWPTLAVRAEYQHGDLSNTGVVMHDSRVMLVMDYVPGAGLSGAAGVDAAEARVSSLRESREAARRELIVKVSGDYEDHLSSLSRRQDILRTLKAATEVLASYDRLFIAGKRNWLDVLNAARELMQVEMSLADIDALCTASYQRLRLHQGEFPLQQGVSS